MSHQNQNFTNTKWDAVQAKYYEMLFSCLVARARRALHGREADAMDLAQETLERFVIEFRQRPRPSVATAKAWSFLTIDRLVIGEWRKREVRLRALADPAVTLRVVSDPAEEDLEAAAATEEVWAEVDEAARLLSPKLREVFVLHQGGLDRHGIAAQLQIRPSAVRKRLHDARARLREVAASGSLLRRAHYAVRSRPRHDGPGPAAAARS